MGSSSKEKIMIREKEIIKPASRTPPTKKLLKLSLMDQFASSSHIPVVFIYRTTGDPNKAIATLKTSLSKTLALFYPFAGKVIGNSYVDCNDDGAEFIEAEINCSLSEFFTSLDLEKMRQFLPARVETKAKLTGFFVRVQATFFKCGGLALGVCLSHKLVDGATMITFYRCWSSMALSGRPKDELIPVFMGDSIVPQLDLSFPTLDSDHEKQPTNIEMRRFLFDPIKIAALKAKAASSNNPNPTAVQALFALIWKCATQASRSKRGRTRPSMMTSSINLRTRLVPPLPQNYAGNLLGIIYAEMPQDGCEIGLPDLANEIKKDLRRLSDKISAKKKFTGQDVMEMFGRIGTMYMNDEVDYYMSSSWYRLGLYSIDFGWGEPEWLCPADSSSIKNIIILNDTKDNKGIEVWMWLEKEEMNLLESDPEFLEFGRLAPTNPIGLSARL